MNGYNNIINNTFYTNYVNNRFEHHPSNDDCNKTWRKGKLVSNGTFKEKNRLPYNHWRKERICKNRCLDANGKLVTNQVIYKDNLAINCKCRTKPNPPNQHFISSYKALHESRNKNYENNLKFPSSEYVDKLGNKTKINKTVVKFRNPTFKTNGAVSGRNRIAALKNGNNHNNVYKKRCDIRESWNKKNIVPKKCKPYHYGGKWKFALLSCPPKN